MQPKSIDNRHLNRNNESTGTVEFRVLRGKTEYPVIFQEWKQNEKVYKLKKKTEIVNFKDRKS